MRLQNTDDVVTDTRDPRKCTSLDKWETSEVLTSGCLCGMIYSNIKFKTSRSKYFLAEEMKKLNVQLMQFGSIAS